MEALPLSPQVFAILGSLIEEKTGLHYSLADRELLAEKVSTRAQDAGFTSLLDYYYFLRYDEAGEAELASLVDALVVNETYFFREFDQLRVAVSTYVEPAVREGRKVRIWSAACSTGEEPLTLAMLLADRGVLDSVEIVASDISSRALEKARSGVYGKRSVRVVPDHRLLERYLQRTDDGFRVADELRAAIQWRRLNLLDRAAVGSLGLFDVILCRNVLIYFRDETARQVLDNLTSALRSPGSLFVGVSESLLRFGTSLAVEEHGGVFVYRKVVAP